MKMVVTLRSFPSVDSPSIFGIFYNYKPLYYVRQFFKIRVVFHTLYLCNEVGDPIFFFFFFFFFAFLTRRVTHYLTVIQILENIYQIEIFARSERRSKINFTLLGPRKIDINLMRILR